jgi:hypothetical protein
MTTVCPHCHTLVLPGVDGRCPSCQRDVRDTRGVDPSRVLVVLREGERLPDFCCLCDGPTEDRVSIVKTTGGSRLLGSRWFQVTALVFLGAVIGFFSWLPVEAKREAIAGLLYLAAAILILVLFGLSRMAPAMVIWSAMNRNRSGPSERTAKDYRRRRTVRVRLPLCRQCRDTIPEPVRVDFEEFEMAFLLSKDFSRRV